jgi:hypothetical protein
MAKFEYEMLESGNKKIKYNNIIWRNDKNDTPNRDYLKNRFIDTDGFIDKIKKIFGSDELKKAMIYKFWNDEEKINEINQTLNNKKLLKEMNNALNKYDPLPMLDWDLLIRSIWPDEYHNFMSFYDNYLVFRVAFLITGKVEKALDSTIHWINKIKKHIKII